MMTEAQKEKARNTRERKALISAERVRRLEAVKAELEKIVVGENSTVEEKLEAARLIATLDGIRH